MLWKAQADVPIADSGTLNFSSPKKFQKSVTEKVLNRTSKVLKNVI